jgi:non-canonical poly(A) RNA polymerase PAPD5/7
MDKYRPNYQDYPPPPPPPDMPPLPRGPPPPLSWNGHGDSYRPSDSRYYPQERIPQSDFTFRNDNYAPHYPREQDHPRDMQPGQSQYATRENDYSRGAQPTQYARQGDNRPRARNSHRDDANINRPRRGNHQNNRPYKVAPADRPLLRRQNDGGNSPEQMLGMATGQAKFMAAGDVSDSGEEQMELSDSEVGQVEENHEQLATPNTAGSEHPDEEASERPTKRRATATGSRDGASEPKWSNPDPYTVLPPVDDEQRKRKDVVKLIRKARKDADDGKTGEHNQVAANDDFISFGMDDGMDDEPTTIDEAPSSPRPDWREEYGPGVPGAPSEPRAFSHLQNLHNQNNGAPGTNGHTVLADSMGPPPGLAQAPTAPPSLPEQVVLDTYPFESEDTSNSFGNRKRNHDCISKSESGRPMQKSKKSPPVQANGSILADWVPSPELDPTPWLQRPGFLTANAGFR